MAQTHGTRLSPTTVVTPQSSVARHRPDTVESGLGVGHTTRLVSEGVAHGCREDDVRPVGVEGVLKRLQVAESRQVLGFGSWVRCPSLWGLRGPHLTLSSVPGGPSVSVHYRDR